MHWPGSAPFSSQREPEHLLEETGKLALRYAHQFPGRTASCGARVFAEEEPAPPARAREPGTRAVSSDCGASCLVWVVRVIGSWPNAEMQGAGYV